jgi:hypothetical protein
MMVMLPHLAGSDKSQINRTLSDVVVETSLGAPAMFLATLQGQGI